jgi:hypothetical protein
LLCSLPFYAGRRLDKSLLRSTYQSLRGLVATAPCPAMPHQSLRASKSACRATSLPPQDGVNNTKT